MTDHGAEYHYSYMRFYDSAAGRYVESDRSGYQVSRQNRYPCLGRR